MQNVHTCKAAFKILAGRKTMELSYKSLNYKTFYYSYSVTETESGFVVDRVESASAFGRILPQR